MQHSHVLSNKKVPIALDQPSVHPTAKVRQTGHAITRDTVCANDTVLLAAIQELGCKISVDSFEVHIQSFYQMLNLAVTCALECIGCENVHVC